jgi:integrase
VTPNSFDLDAEVPVARLKGSETKNKKAAEQPLPSAVVTRLRNYCTGRAHAKPLWPGTWAKRCADMLKLDLEAAGIALSVNDESALIHSLRHTYTSWLARSAPVKVTQELSRHSTPTLTIGHYSHATLAEKAEAVAALPLPGSASAIAGQPVLPGSAVREPGGYRDSFGCTPGCTNFAPEQGFRGTGGNFGR